MRKRGERSEDGNGENTNIDRELDDKKLDDRKSIERWDSGYENGHMWK